MNIDLVNVENCASCPPFVAVDGDYDKQRGQCRSGMEFSTLSAGTQEHPLLEHLPMVRSVAQSVHRRLPRHIELEELISAGTLGLLDAVSRYDAARHSQFKAYARLRIRGAIIDFLRSTDWSPRELRRKNKAVKDVTIRMTATLGCEPTSLEMAQQLGLRLDEYQRLLAELDRLVIDSLDAKGRHCIEELRCVAGRASDSPLMSYLDNEVKGRLTQALGMLPERESLIIMLYHYEDLSMREVGEVLGLGESRVSQLRASGIRRLRKILGVNVPACPSEVVKLPGLLQQGRRGRTTSLDSQRHPSTGLARVTQFALA